MDIAALRAAGARHLIQGELLSDVVPAADGPIFVRAEGAEIFDAGGKPYLDFNLGQMCSALGHNNPRVTAAVRERLGTLTHASSVYFNAPQLRLAARLAETFDAPLSRSLFIQSGADSNEAAVLFARCATGRSGIGALHLAFHDYTDVTRAMSFAAATTGNGPPIPDLHAIPAPYAYRSPVGAEGADWWRPLLSVSFDLLDRECPNNLAAVIAEPLISAGGVIEMPPGYLKALKEGLEARGALLILDEAQTGLGTLYAYRQHGVVPDIMTLSKHFGGGLPISAMVTTDAIAERALEGAHGGAATALPHDRARCAARAACRGWSWCATAPAGSPRATRRRRSTASATGCSSRCGASTATCSASCHPSAPATRRLTAPARSWRMRSSARAEAVIASRRPLAAAGATA